MDLNVAAEMSTFAVGKQLIYPPKMFPWQLNSTLLQPPPISSHFLRKATGTDP